MRGPASPQYCARSSEPARIETCPGTWRWPRKKYCARSSERARIETGAIPVGGLVLADCARSSERARIETSLAGDPLSDGFIAHAHQSGRGLKHNKSSYEPQRTIGLRPLIRAGEERYDNFAGSKISPGDIAPAHQ